MPLFDFALTPIVDVEPWDHGLHWFGLTHGRYHLDLNEEQLFRYSQEILLHWRTQHPALSADDVHVDYQVARLYEDVLEILPDVLQPIPPEMQDLISDCVLDRTWWTHPRGVPTPSEDFVPDRLFCCATEWWGARQLHSWHLTAAPLIAFWLCDDIMHICWENSTCQIDGIPAWAARRGMVRLPRDAFMCEVESFHRRLMSSMRERVETIAKNNPIPHIKIDVPRLVQEQADREQSLACALKRRPRTVDWDEVAAAIRKLRQLGG